MLYLRKLAIQGMLIVLMMLFAISADCSETIYSGFEDQSTEMNASVHVLLNAIEVINNDDFPWYGLIITVNKYSTRYYFNHPNWPFLSDDSILEPNELTSPTLSGSYSNKDGNTWAFESSVKKIKLEAKSQVDGPYDLKYEISKTHANATPTVERPPILRIWIEGRHPMDPENTWVKPHQPQYEEISAIVSEYRRVCWDHTTYPKRLMRRYNAY